MFIWAVKKIAKIAVHTLVVSSLVCLAACGDDKPSSNSKDGSKFVGETNTMGLSPELAAKVVAKVGDETITVGDVTEQINRLSPYIKRRWATPEKRKEFLQKLIQIELLSQEAIRQGLDNSPEVQRAVKQVMIRLMVKNDLQKELFPSSVDEDRLKQEYDKQWLKYHTPAQHRISQIVVASQSEALSLIAQIQEAPSPRGQFRELARTISIDEASKNRAGDIGYVINPEDIAKSKANGPSKTFLQAENIADSIAKAGWELKTQNELRPQPVKTAQGYHILMLTTIRPALNRSFNSVKRMIENRLLRELKKEKMDDFVASLRKKANLKIYAENLDKVKLDAALKNAESAIVPQEDELSATEASSEPENIGTPQEPAKNQEKSDISQ